MNAPIRKLAALATAMALATPAIAAMSPQDTTTDELDRMEQDASPPPVSDVDDRMDPVDPEVDAMTRDPMQDQTMQDPTMQERGMQDDRWSTLDSDGDGRISREEAQVDADLSANFDMMDADGDGFVSDSEFQVGAEVDTGVEPEEGDDW